MSLLPVFKVALWNAWIVIVLLFVGTMLPMFFSKEKMEKRTEDEPTYHELGKVARTANVINHQIIMPLTFIYSIFLPMKLGTMWFFIGFPICLLALVMNLVTSITFTAATGEEPITSGIYSISRHPMYVATFICYFGIGIACASWVFLLCALVWIVAWRYGIAEEERLLQEKYGESYREYMKRTPRWIGFPRA